MKVVFALVLTCAVGMQQSVAWADSPEPSQNPLSADQSPTSSDPEPVVVAQATNLASRVAVLPQLTVAGAPGVFDSTFDTILDILPWGGKENWGFEFVYDNIFMSWDPDPFQTAQSIQYQVAQAALWSAGGFLTWQGSKIFGGTLQQPYQQAADQTVGIKAGAPNGSKFSSIDIFAYPTRFFTNDMQDGFLKRILTPRVGYVKRTFIGSALALNSIDFITDDNSIITLSSTGTFFADPKGDLSPLQVEPGETFSFKTRFDDIRVSWALFGENVSDTAVSSHNFGFYYSNYTKPFESNFFKNRGAANERRAILDADYKSIGGLYSYVREPVRDGFTVNFDIGLGKADITVDEVLTQLPSFKAEDAINVMVNIYLAYTFEAGGDAAGRGVWRFTPFGEVNGRGFAGAGDINNVVSGTGTVDLSAIETNADIAGQVGLRIAYLY